MLLAGALQADGCGGAACLTRQCLAATAGDGLGAQVGTVREMIAAEGWVSLTRRMSARALKIGSGQAVTFGVFDCVKRRL